MTNKFIFLALSLLFNTFNSNAQLKNLTMDDAVLGLRTNLAPKTLKQLQWIPGVDRITWLTSDERTKQEYWLSAQPPFKTIDTLYRMSEFITLCKSLNLEIKRFPALKWLNSTSYTFINQNDRIFIDIKNNKLIKKYTWDSDAENLEFTTDFNRAAYTMDQNVFITDNGRMLQITNDNLPGIENGKAVHRNEFGITKGLFWSNKGDKLAYYKLDETMIATYPLLNLNSKPASVNSIHYPMAGTTNHIAKIMVYNISSQKHVMLETGDADQYLTNVVFTPNGEEIYVAIVNRAQNKMWLNAYDAATGKFIKTLFEETNEKYVEPENPPYFLSKNANDFLWLSEKDGWQHVYKYQHKEGRLTQITKGNFEVANIISIDPKSQNALVYSNKLSPLNKNTFWVDLKTGKMDCLQPADGQHTSSLSESGNWAINQFQGPITPRAIQIIPINNISKPVDLFIAPNPLEGFKTAQVRLVTLLTKDKTNLYGKLMVPADFDSSKTYPVIVYLYGGPHNQLIKNSFPESGNLWYDYLCNKGYIVFSMDNRGSSGRGLAFEQATFRQLGKIELEDQLVGINYLKSLRFIDPERMGIHGWSFGGFMATQLMLKYPIEFKVGVAGGPVMDWKYYEIMYTERYMDTPEENPKGYEDNNLIAKAGNLKGKLLLIHCTDDDVVVWQHSLLFLKKCIETRTYPDYFVYPGHAHNVQGKDRVHLMQKITDYFDQYLMVP